MLSEHQSPNGAEPVRYTLGYRAAETSLVRDWLQAGQSGCVIGLRGAGKSSFLRFLLRADVRQYYLGSDSASFVFILVDLLALTEHTEWAVWELILDRLVIELRTLQVAPQVVDEIAALHREVMRTRDPLIARRAIEQGVSILCDRSTSHVVVLFDEFDAIFRVLDPFLFRSLRAICDAHREQVSCIVAVTNDLAYLRDNLSEIDPFYRLLNRNVCFLGPLDERAARERVRFLASQRHLKLSEEDTTRVIQLSGGHGGLFKAILSLLWDPHRQGDLSRLASTLMNEPAIQVECRKVWEGLSESERTALRALAAGLQADPQMLYHLKRRGLLQEDQSGTSMFSPLFADFVNQQAPPPKKGLLVSRYPRRVQVNGQSIETLTELEFDLLCYLYEHRDHLCTKDDLVENVYHQQYERMVGGVTDEALQTLIARLRAKIEPPRYIITVRGEGYKLIES